MPDSTVGLSVASQQCDRTTVCVLDRGHRGLCERPGGVRVVTTADVGASQESLASGEPSQVSGGKVGVGQPETPLTLDRALRAMAEAKGLRRIEDAAREVVATWRSGGALTDRMFEPIQKLREALDA